VGGHVFSLDPPSLTLDQKRMTHEFMARRHSIYLDQNGYSPVALVACISRGTKKDLDVRMFAMLRGISLLGASNLDLLFMGFVILTQIA